MRLEKVKKNYRELLKRCCGDHSPSVKELNTSRKKILKCSYVSHGGRWWKVEKINPDGRITITYNGITIYRY